ncbi:MAG TPA: STAS domain-containing protein [Actinomycetota bacterium]|nr:STAS domain-containing protein [Actinomycetota bacterium]
MIFEVTTLPTGALNLSGELDMATVGALDSALRPLCASGGPVTIQVSDLTFMDSTGIHALVRASQELEGRGCVIIHGVDGNARLRKVLELTRVDDVQNIHLIECDVL